MRQDIKNKNKGKSQAEDIGNQKRMNIKAEGDIFANHEQSNNGKGKNANDRQNKNASERNNDNRRKENSRRLADERRTDEISGDGNRGNIRMYEEGLGTTFNYNPNGNERDRRAAQSERLVSEAKAIDKTVTADKNPSLKNDYGGEDELIEYEKVKGIPTVHFDRAFPEATTSSQIPLTYGKFTTNKIIDNNANCVNNEGSTLTGRASGPDSAIPQGNRVSVKYPSSTVMRSPTMRTLPLRWNSQRAQGASTAMSRVIVDDAKVIKFIYCKSNNAELHKRCGEGTVSAKAKCHHTPPQTKKGCRLSGTLLFMEIILN